MASSLFLLFLSISLFQSLHQNPSFFVNGDTNLIQKTCKTTKYYNTCISALKSNSTSTKTDTKGLATIVIRVAISNATKINSYLSSKALNNHTLNDGLMKKVFNECAIKYEYAVDALRDSVLDLAAESNDYAYLHVLAASDYANSCHNMFKGTFPVMAYPNELSVREDGFKHLCDVALGIIDFIGW